MMAEGREIPEDLMGMFRQAVEERKV